MRFLLCQFHTQPWQLTFSSYGSYVVRKETAYRFFSQYLSCLILSRLLLEVMFLSVMHLDNCLFCYVVSHIWRSNITALNITKLTLSMILTVLLISRTLPGRRKILDAIGVVTLFTFHGFLYCFFNNKSIFFIVLLLACWQWRASSGFVLMVFWLHTSRRMRMMRRKSVPSSSLPKMEILRW